MTTTTNAERLALADRLEAAVTHEGAPVYPYGDGRLRKLIVSAVVALRAQLADAGVRGYRGDPEILANALMRCQTVLSNMAMENEGAIFRRWPINHEPLRSDARNLLPVIDAALAGHHKAAMAEIREQHSPRPALNDPVVDPRNSDEGDEDEQPTKAAQFAGLANGIERSLAAFGHVTLSGDDWSDICEALRFTASASQQRLG